MADNVVVGADQTVPVGGSGSFQVYLEEEDIADGDTINNCNAGGGNGDAVTVSFTTTNAALVAAPASLTFTGCDSPGTPNVIENVQTVSFSVPTNAPVGATVTLTASASGGRTLGNNPRVVGTFDPDSITITTGALANPCAAVAPPSAPMISSVPVAAGGNDDWFRTTPTVSASTPGASVTYSTDNSTWSSTPPTLGEGITTVYAKAETFAGTTSCGVASSQREFKVDTVAPVVLPGDVTDTTWRNSSLSQAFTASDGTSGSGLAQASDASFTLTASADSSLDGLGAVIPTVATRTVTDVAGNSTTRSLSAWIDSVDPYVSEGVVDTAWRNTSLSRDFTASDALSGLLNASDSSFTLTATADSTLDSSGQVVPTVVSKSVFDRAGNSVSRSVSARIDTVAPTVTCPPAPTFIQGSAGTVTADVADALSGAVASQVSAPAVTSTVGHGSVTLTGHDNAGNDHTVSCSYNVVYKWSGFFQPIDVLGGDAGVSTITDNTVWNSAKAGSAIPVKFSLNGNQGLNILATGSPRSVAVKCPSATATVDPIETLSGTTSGLKYDSLLDQYNYTWKTSSGLAGTCQRLEVKLVDDTTHYAFFKFTR